MLSLLVVVAAAVSPLTIDVATSDGLHRAVEVTDADATPVQVCARKREVPGEVCGDVANDRYGLRAVVPTKDEGDLTFSLRVTRFDSRFGAPAALAGGFALLSVATGVSAFVVAGIASGAPDPAAAASTAVDPPVVDVRSPLSALSVSLVVVSGAAALGAGIAGYVAFTEANHVVAE